MLSDFVAEVFASAAVSAALVAALAFVTRSWLSERLKNAIRHEYEHRLESHKAQLQAQNEIDIERLRAQLAIAAHEQQTRFTGLHEKRAEVVSTVYSLLRELHVALADYTKIFEPEGGKSKDERRKAAAEAHKTFIEYYRGRRLFLPKPAVEMIDKINGECVDIFHSFMYEIEMRDPARSEASKWLALSQKAQSGIASALSELEDTFRKILGDEG